MMKFKGWKDCYKVKVFEQEFLVLMIRESNTPSGNPRWRAYVIEYEIGFSDKWYDCAEYLFHGHYYGMAEEARWIANKHYMKVYVNEEM